ncbi:hypothetical protein AMTR_s00076p00110780 [Amborella trichopoda]|uniref:Uncharacterized protein n=1 Tax=Amborella trichopoda TaxID=13333 RepID=W1P485_AMBTC|nr:hypothetical protein AMTR_s00076p00110780 [Amborella trichopoda]
MRFLPNSSLLLQPLSKSFLCFGYEVSLEALDKGAIEILGPYGISYTFRRLAERISQLQSGSLYEECFMTCGRLPGGRAAPPLWVNRKPDSMNPRKGSTAVIGALRLEHFSSASKNVRYMNESGRFLVFAFSGSKAVKQVIE